MVFQKNSGDQRRFQVALFLSVLLHGAVAGGSVGWGLFALTKPHPLFRRSPTADRSDSDGGATQLIYIETTGETLQLSRRDAVRPEPACPAGRPVEGRIDRADDRSCFPAEGGPALRGDTLSTNGQIQGSADKALQPYLDQIRAKLSRAIRYAEGQPGGEVLLHFTLNKRGDLESVRLLQQSARTSNHLQQEAVRGLRSAAPFSPLPAHWTKDSASFTVRILFRDSHV